MTSLRNMPSYRYFLRKPRKRSLESTRALPQERGDEEALRRLGGVVPFDVFNRVARAEWDTLLFFYGVVMCVGGLGYMGYLELMSQQLYSTWSPTAVNVFLGLTSAVIDNIPVMFAVLT